MAQSLSVASSTVRDLIKKSQRLSPGPPALHRLCTTRSNLDEGGKIRKWTFGQKYANVQNNTILLVGETGTGKTTLINTMVNHFLGVKFEDKVWFEITEEEKRDQTESQTSEITVYEIYKEKQSLTIIDTPGYGDTRGIDKDTEIPQNLRQLFLDDTGVKELDAVCLVLKASQNRISEVQHYIFEAVLSLFGKDIQDIIVLFITHSDGLHPTNALDAIKKEEIPCCHNKNGPVYFLFNNCQSERQKQTEKQKLKKTQQHIFQSAWNTGEDSLKDFLRFLKPSKRKSLSMTVSVLVKREQLQACVQNLKERIEFTESTQTELSQIQKTLEQHKEEIVKDGKFPFTVMVTYRELVDSGYIFDRIVTRCDTCKLNCHQYLCWFAKSAETCTVMKDGKCTVCNCHYVKHKRESKKYVTKQKEERVTFADLKEKYINKRQVEVTYDKTAFKAVETGHDEMLKRKEELTTLEGNLKTLLAENEKEKKILVKEAYETVTKLSDIALKPDSAFTLLYLDFLIPRLEEAGEEVCAQKLKDMRKATAKESTRCAVRYLERMKNYFGAGVSGLFGAATTSQGKLKSGGRGHDSEV